MTTATNITIPCTPKTLAVQIQQFKASITETLTIPQIAGRPMSASEIAAFLNAASHDPDKISGLLLACTLLSGIPPLTLAAAEWHWHEPDAGNIVVIHDCENYTSFQLSTPALDMVLAMGMVAPEVPWVFHQDGDPVSTDDLIDAFDRITLDAGIFCLDISDLVMAYQYVVVFAALFDVPLLPSVDGETSAFDDDEEEFDIRC